MLLYCSAAFYLHAHRKGSVAFKLLAFSLALWAVLIGAVQSSSPWMEMFGSVGHVLGPVPQMLLGIAMVMVLFENERNAVQENTLALSTLGVDPRRLLSADDLLPSMQSALDRLAGALSARQRDHLHLGTLARPVALGRARIFFGIPRIFSPRPEQENTSANWPTVKADCSRCMTSPI